VARGLERSLLKGLGIKEVYPMQARGKIETRIEELPHPSVIQGFGRHTERSSFELFPLDEEGIRIIDQHNAHERILYEQYTEIDRTKAWPRKLTLLPVLFDLSPSQELGLEENHHLLEDAGFRVEAMGGSSFALKEYPDIFKEEEAKDVFLSLLEEMSEKKIEDKKYTILATLACKTAIKVGESLSFDKMTYLVEELEKTKNPSLCPHGRPIQVKLDRTTIEKGLKRT
jgi:DNA mismatch repair protein MutL